MTGKLILAAFFTIVAEMPTEDGKWIGTATMDREGRISMQLRTMDCSGIISEGISEAHPADSFYGQDLTWVGRIRSGKTKLLFAWNVRPCTLRQFYAHNLERSDARIFAEADTRHAITCRRRDETSALKDSAREAA